MLWQREVQHGSCASGLENTQSTGREKSWKLSLRKQSFHAKLPLRKREKLRVLEQIINLLYKKIKGNQKSQEKTNHFVAKSWVTQKDKNKLMLSTDIYHKFF